MNNNQQQQLLDYAKKLVKRYRIRCNSTLAEHEEFLSIATIALLEGKSDKEVMQAIDKYVKDNSNIRRRNKGYYIIVNDCDIARNEDGDIIDERYNEVMATVDVDVLAENDYYNKIIKVLNNRLSEKQIEVLELRISGFSTTEIARMLKVSKQAISDRLLGIRRSCKDLFPRL